MYQLSGLLKNLRFFFFVVVEVYHLPLYYARQPLLSVAHSIQLAVMLFDLRVVIVQNVAFVLRIQSTGIIVYSPFDKGVKRLPGQMNTQENND